MSLATFPKRVILSQIADEGLHWSGELPFDFFARVAKEAFEVQGNHESELTETDTNFFVDLHILPDKRNEHMFLCRIEATGNIPLQCQRCLQRFMQFVSVNTQITLIDNQALENLLYEDEDFLVLEDISNYTQKVGLDVVELIEDELLLSIPISPKHDECEMSVQSVGEIPETQDEDDNPFSVLADLKGKL